MNDSIHDDFHNNYPRYLNILNVPDDLAIDQIEIPELIGSGAIKRTKLRPGMELVIADCRLHQKQTLHFQSDVPMIELSFWLKGNNDVNLSGKPLHIRDNHCQLAFMQHLDAEMYCTANEPILACEIRLAESVFIDLVETLGGDTRLDIKQIVAAEPVRIFQQAIQPSEQLLVRQLLNCPFEPPLRKMYIEGKALELLAIYLQKCLFDTDDSIPRNGKGLRRTDLDKICAAADMLVARMDQPPSLLELSRMAGISDFKLKTGFRELYGTTVFGYLRDKRMEQALFLLETEGISVYEAAIATGYSNPSHFASVFREKYGFNPGQWGK
ncbi:AraC family transcriptional regulator [Paenibacillus baekrokdamisoli]|uniref:AraC family transcriptional regulator n=1 Tax=Paenibacillus baekrokdamisoli TaxID=1712516 RepID=A0A3G9IY85_9BACL|nr:AraC family transcriptional regulator [Paenibacillus baekrokdamisoli]MBB3069019.1 AraC-like DNA-binding protein [Paenibacillus baekrokdamisoli]BBH23840.1 AraC family transcriptional regulator [Paenibacillus baekrokdamisoli]